MGKALRWDQPVEPESPDWAISCAPLWEALVTLAAPWRESDSLTAQAWDAAVTRLDTRPEPVTVAAQNARWRGFVLDVWAIRDATMRRRWTAHRALAKRSPAVR